MKANRLSVLITATAILLAPLTLRASGEGISVDPLKPKDVNSDGAFWTWFLPKSGSGKVVKIAEMDMGDEGHMVLRINGNIQRLMKRSGTWRPERASGPRVGDVCEEVWGNATYVMTLSYKMTNSGEEYSAFSGQMEVSPSSTAWRAGMHAAPAVLKVEGETGS